MQKKWLLLLIPIAICSLIWFIHRQPAKTFQLSDQADAYVVTTKGIYTFKQENGKLKLINDQRANIAEFVRYVYPRARFDNRYLVFTKGWDFPQSYPTAAVSMDFQTGTIRTNKTEYFADSGAGQTEDYFYTWRTYTDETIICQFDKYGKQIQTKTYDGLLLPSSSFTSNNQGILQLEAVRDWHDGNFHSQLLTIDEKDLTLLSEETIYEPESQHYRFGHSIVEKNLLYTPVNSIRDMVSKEVAPSNQLLITDLDTGQQEFLTLPEYGPYSTYRQGDYLIIEHDAAIANKIGFSLVNTSTWEMNFIDLTEFFNEDPTRSSIAFLQFFSLDENGHLLFMAGKELFYVDSHNQEILDHFKLTAEEEPIYIWAINENNH